MDVTGSVILSLSWQQDATSYDCQPLGPGNDFHTTWTLLSWHFRVSNWTNSIVSLLEIILGVSLEWTGAWTQAWPWKLFLPLNWTDRMSYLWQEGLLWAQNLSAPARWLKRWIWFFLLLANLPSEVQAVCVSHKHFYKSESKERKNKAAHSPTPPLETFFC